LQQLAEVLDAAGIKLCSYAIDRTHRAPCPRCDKGPRDDALAVTIHASDDVVWTCHRCSWSGGWRSCEMAPERPVRVAPAKANHGSGLSEYGRRLWRESREISADCPAGRWLANRRCAAELHDVRWHPSVWHAGERRAFAAMLALITDIRTCEPLSLHVTYLTDDGQKAAGGDARRYLANCTTTGGVIRLSRDEEVTQGLVIGEGIETCATALLGIAPAWSCMDAGHVAAFPVLSGIESLTVLIDDDPAGRQAFAEVRERWQRAGREVIGLKSPAGNDLNDWVRAA